MISTAMAHAQLSQPSSKESGALADFEGLERVYRDHHAFMWRSLCRLGVPNHALDDAVHDAFLVVARRLGEFEGRSEVRTWLFAIAMRVAQSFRRDRAREQRHAQTLQERQESADLTVQPAARSDAAMQLHQLLLELDEDKRAVFIMAELEQMTAPEIAATVGAKVATVYSRLRLAREQLERAVRAQRSGRMQ